MSGMTTEAETELLFVIKENAMTTQNSDSLGVTENHAQEVDTLAAEYQRGYEAGLASNTAAADLAEALERCFDPILRLAAYECHTKHAHSTERGKAERAVIDAAKELQRQRITVSGGERDYLAAAKSLVHLYEVVEALKALEKNND